MDNAIRLLGLIVLLCIDLSSSWIQSTFFVNMKLPKECGRGTMFSLPSNYAALDAWPWLGQLHYSSSGRSRCNVVLIHPQVALAGTLCIRDTGRDPLSVTFSLPGIPSYQTITVTHIDFLKNDKSLDNIAMLKLQRPVVISERVHPICLWEGNLNYTAQLDSHYGLVIGSDFIPGSMTNIRTYQTPVLVIAQDRCRAADEEFYYSNLRNSVCLLYYKEPVTCHYIGSILMFPRLGEDGSLRWYLRGIQTQRVYYCNEGKYSPSFDLAVHRTWIENHFKSSVEASCGRRAIIHTPLVTLGQEADRGDWPWHGALYSRDVSQEQGSYRCGSSLISTTAVVTAAHCVTLGEVPMEASRLSVVLGKHDLTVREPGASVHNVSRVIVHEEYNRRKLTNDIAILILSNAVVYSEYIQPACLWDEIDTSKKSIYNKFGTVPGWGLNELDQQSTKLAYASMPVVDDLVCYQSHENFYYTFLTNRTFCAGNPRGNRTNVCNGDSGGGFVIPVIQDDRVQTWYLRGIVSVTVTKEGSRICNPNYNVIYTDVASYLGWITQKTT